MKSASERMSVVQSMAALSGATGLNFLGRRCVVYMESLIKFAEYRLNEAVEQHEGVAVTQYWVGYLDGLRAAQRELAKEKQD